MRPNEDIAVSPAGRAASAPSPPSSARARPYARAGADLDGRVGIDWAVYGVPETFVVDAEGRIGLKQIGAVTPEILEKTILPLVAKLRAEARPGS